MWDVWCWLAARRATPDTLTQQMQIKFRAIRFRRKSIFMLSMERAALRHNFFIGQEKKKSEATSIHWYHNSPRILRKNLLKALLSSSKIYHRKLRKIPHTNDDERLRNTKFFAFCFVRAMFDRWPNWILTFIAVDGRVQICFLTWSKVESQQNVCDPSTRTESTNRVCATVCSATKTSLVSPICFSQEFFALDNFTRQQNLSFTVTLWWKFFWKKKLLQFSLHSSHLLCFVFFFFCWKLQ